VQVAIVTAMLPGAFVSLRVALEPPELGRVEVRIARGADGDTVRILAERPETLALLQRDQRELGRALDQAGVQAGGGLSLGLAGREGGSAGGDTAPRRDRSPSGQGSDAEAEFRPAPSLTAPSERRAVLNGLLDIAV
jgi:hypothetical protein